MIRKVGIFQCEPCGHRHSAARAELVALAIQFDGCDVERLGVGEKRSDQQQFHDSSLIVFGAIWDVASMPPRPMVSTAVDGTMTMAPFSLMAS